MFFKYLEIRKHLQKYIRLLFSKVFHPRWMVFAFDNLSVFFIFLFAYLLRFNFVLADFSVSLALHHAIIGLSVYAIFFLIFRSYAGLIRHTTVMDIFTVLASTSLALQSFLPFR